MSKIMRVIFPDKRTNFANEHVERSAHGSHRDHRHAFAGRSPSGEFERLATRVKREQLSATERRSSDTEGFILERRAARILIRDVVAGSLCAKSQLVNREQRPSGWRLQCRQGCHVDCWGWPIRLNPLSATCVRLKLNRFRTMANFRRRPVARGWPDVGPEAAVHAVSLLTTGSPLQVPRSVDTVVSRSSART